MRSLLPLFSFFFLLTILACEKPEDEILPPPPVAQVTPEAPEEELPEEPEKQIPIEVPEYFQAQHFGNLPYRILLPRNYDSTKVYPLLFFLHGIGERGQDNSRQLDIGGSYFLGDTIREKYPAFIIYPQCPSNRYWFDSPVMDDIKGLADMLLKKYPVDPKRISLAGFSMGAFGTFEMVSRYPGFFESAVAISGGGDESNASKMAESRWNIFAGARDDVVPSTQSKKMAEALTRAGAAVSFTLFPKADHTHTWIEAFSKGNLFAWWFGTRDSAPPDL